MRRSQQPIARGFNIIIDTEYDSAIALSEIALKDLNRAFINIIDRACFAVFQKQKNGQQ
ncbi:hypothetical protein [Microcoleus asticus]|uniref:hypothetical protein n=1 Tax=Microcoleus asticus TaxID=2815231 RepID=UPI001556DDAA|nr:hypothetical protein [Microcoleus asticus]